LAQPSRHRQILLADDFNRTDSGPGLGGVDSDSNWNPITPGSVDNVEILNDQLRLTNGGWALSRSSIGTPFYARGTATFGGGVSTDDTLGISVRSTGADPNVPVSPPTSGIILLIDQSTGGVEYRHF
jgi:hypothetical protein